MKEHTNWFPHRPMPLTIWSKGASELIPDRFRRIITVVMPLLYILLILFGITAAIVPVPTFESLVGTFLGTGWAIGVASTSIISLLGLIFRTRIEIYSSIVLSFILAIYPFFIMWIVFHDPSHQDFSRLGVIFAVMIYPVMPAWRVVDIVLEIRKSRQRQLYAKVILGEA